MKLRSSYVCQQCGYETPQWYGKCPNCNEWNTLIETVKEVGTPSKGGIVRERAPMATPLKLSDVRHIEKNRIKSTLTEFDRVVGGGIVPGSVTLLAGDPGIGKSTLLLHVIGAIGGLYISGEESAEQVKLRAKRLGIEGKNISILPETNAENIVAALSGMTEKQLVVVDSIQTLSSSELEGMAGSVGQIRHSAELL
ncbi:AAA family ATPase, partial [Candidatus Gottesmanbacteria bacterium]|nr:AAA family ATPase [Candidatus Gottesmanbacteria bacterium]